MRAGSVNGHARYGKTVLESLQWSVSGTPAWALIVPISSSLYRSEQDTSFPWQTGAWAVFDGDPPVPTIRQARPWEV